MLLPDPDPHWSIQRPVPCRKNGATGPRRERSAEPAESDEQAGQAGHLRAGGDSGPESRNPRVFTLASWRVVAPGSVVDREDGCQRRQGSGHHTVVHPSATSL